MEGRSEERFDKQEIQSSQKDGGRFKTLDKGWSWVIMLASFGSFCLIGANMYCVGIIHSTLLKRYGETVSLTSWAGSLHTSFMSLGAPLASFVVDKYSCRTAVMLSGTLFAAGYLGTAFAPNIQTAIFTCGIVAGFGAGLGYTASMVVIGFNFKRKRNIALGFALSGTGAGMFALAPLMQLASDFYGPVGFFIIQAAISLNIITFGSMFFPSKLEMYSQEMRKIKSSSDQSQTTWRNVARNYCKALLNKPVVFLSIGMFFYCVGTYLIYLHLPSYVESKGFSSMQAALMVSLSGVLAIIGRLLTGFVSNLKVVKDIWIYSLTMGAVSISTLVYPFISSSLTGHIAYAAILGLFFGSCYVLLALVNIYFVGISFMSAGIGIEFFLGGIGAIVGPVCAGILVDNGGTYDQSLIFAGICILIASILSALTICFKPASEEPHDKMDGSRS